MLEMFHFERVRQWFIWKFETAVYFSCWIESIQVPMHFWFLNGPGFGDNFTDLGRCLSILKVVDWNYSTVSLTDWHVLFQLYQFQILTYWNGHVLCIWLIQMVVYWQLTGSFSRQLIRFLKFSRQLIRNDGN